jgi:hypothetical protein
MNIKDFEKTHKLLLKKLKTGDVNAIKKLLDPNKVDNINQTINNLNTL